MIVPNLRDSLSNTSEASPWLEMMLEVRNTKIYGPRLEALIAWIEQMETTGAPADFRVVLRRPGIASELQGNVTNTPDSIQEDQKLGIHLVG